MLEAKIISHFKHAAVDSFLEEESVIAELRALQKRKILTFEGLTAIALENSPFWPMFVEQSIMSREDEDALALAFKIEKIFSAIKKLILPMPKGYEVSPYIILKVLNDKIDNQSFSSTPNPIRQYTHSIRQ
jgi:hypothetical protein